MKINLSKYSINQKLAFVAFALGFLAIFMRDPSTARVATIDVNELTMKIQDKSSSISVEDMADWLIQKKTDFKLVDLRDDKKFSEYNIPSSINVKLAELAALKLSKTEKIILYSDDNIASAQAWFILKSKHYKSVYLLTGGINEWKEKILFPSLSPVASAEEKAKFAKMVEISKFFGGTPQLAANDTTGNKPAPKLAMPKMSGAAQTAPAAGSKPKREGC
jgi:rhodanese-related sulfurtransferase